MLSRPKRKAAGHKNYSDALVEPLVDELKPAPVRSRKRPPSPAKPPGGPVPPSPGPHNQGKVPFNWQPPPAPADTFSHRLNLEGARVDPAAQVLYCPNQPPLGFSAPPSNEAAAAALLLRTHMNQHTLLPPPKREPGFQLRRGDFIQMVSEPPGEPYYVGRIMGFKRRKSCADAHPDELASAYVFQIQWFYRPRDISKQTSDLRLLFASMHSDTCPLSSFRGVVTVKHKAEVEEMFGGDGAQPLEHYCSYPNHFYFDKLFDRYMIKFYDIIKTSTLLPHIDNSANNSKHFLLALNKRFEFIFMEASRTKQFLNNFNSTSSSHCDICAEWCLPNELVDCAGCLKNFHMLCLDPPLLKKPSRGFSWSCAMCTKKHELEHRSKKTLMLSHDNRSTNEDELSMDEPTESSDHVNPSDPESPHGKSPETILPKYELMAIEYLKNDADVLFEERRLKEEWPLRYLGKHTRLEDAVDPDDRSPYPRACTNLGTRFQATNIPEFEDHPIVYYDPEKPKERVSKLKKSASKSKKPQQEEDYGRLPLPEEYENKLPKDYPAWLQRRPKGYIERGVDDGEGKTCTLMWKPLESDVVDGFSTLDAYMESCKPIAEQLGLIPTSPNFVDAILKIYMETEGNTAKAIAKAKRLTRILLREPTFSKDEIDRFENGVRENGSELYPTFKAVKTQPASMIVRFYYLWKKTDRGRLIWGSFPGRKKKMHKEGKSEEKSEMKVAAIIDDYADSDDDSSYENEKIISKSKLFQCRHCESYQSYKWFKITGFDGNSENDEQPTRSSKHSAGVISALCFRCAKLWRRYAVYWEDPLEIQKRNSRGVGGYRKKIESELIADSQTILEYSEAAGGLCYDINRKTISSSVLGCPPMILKSPPTALARAEKFPKSSLLKELTKGNDVKNPAVEKPLKTDKADSKSELRLTSRQLSLSTKNALKSESSTEEPAPKKRKQNTNTTSHVKVKSEPKDKPQSQQKKRNEPDDGSSKSSGDNGGSTNNKRKRKPETKSSKLVSDSKKVTENTKSASKSSSSVAKRQKNNSTDTETILSPVFNPAYREEFPTVATVTKIDRKMFPAFDKNVLHDIISNYRLRQLTDLKLLTVQNQTPANARVEPPFDVGVRECSICLDNLKTEESLQEMLICSNCGVNVHASCAGITVLGKQKPIKQWLCDPCTNDLSPNHTSNYSCCLCLANELNYEASILGYRSAKPDFLVPILDSGKWCHLACALFSYKDILFRNLATPPFVLKEVLHALNTKSFATAVESVSNVFLENYTNACGICDTLNGALVQCDACEETSKFHITCAQDTENYRIGFKLCTAKVSKVNINTYIKDDVGKLEPIVLCLKHPNHSIYGVRDRGLRTPTGEQRPLIQLFLEDISKSISPKLNGPQFRAQNYISMIAKFMAKEEVVPCKPQFISHESDLQKIKMCSVCEIKSSPRWWSVPNASTVRCQNCKFSDSDDECRSVLEGRKLKKELEEPLEGESCGIKDTSDVIASIYKPSEPMTHEILTQLDSILSCT